MSYSKRVELITSSLEEKIKEIPHGEFRFYNIAHLPLIAKKTSENADICNICLTNLDKIEKLTQSLPDILSESMQSRKLFEKEKDQIESHLKKIHKLRFPGYFTALGSLFGILLGIIATFFISFFTNLDMFNRINLLIFALLLISGRVIGLITDKNVFKKNMQL